MENQSDLRGIHQYYIIPNYIFYNIAGYEKYVLTILSNKTSDVRHRVLKITKDLLLRTKWEERTFQEDKKCIVLVMRKIIISLEI